MRLTVVAVVALASTLVSCASIAQISFSAESGPYTVTSTTDTKERDESPASSPQTAPVEEPAGSPQVVRPATLVKVPASSIYERLPDPSRGNPGVLRASERAAVLDEVNLIRSLHGLAPVVYDERFDKEVTAAALIFAANATLTHDPGRTMRSYTEEGARGAQRSNIHIGFSTDPSVSPSIAHVREWLIDDQVPSLGHRRWLLDPFLPSVSYGRVDGRPAVASQWPYVGGSAIKVVHDTDARLDPARTPGYVAYPYGDYPRAFADPAWFWSFAVIADPADRWASRGVDFSDATITVSAGAAALRVRDVRHDNQGFGLPNSLQWLVEGARTGVEYEVVVGNVVVDGARRSFEYRVRVVD